MGVLFYRHIDPSSKGYTELRYYSRWHESIVETELKQIEKAKQQAAAR